MIRKVTINKRFIISFLSVLLLFQAIAPIFVVAQDTYDADIRIYLKNGDVVTGNLIELSPSLVIVRVGKEAFTFYLNEVEYILTLKSTGAQIKTVKAWKFPRLGFLGGAVAGGVIAYFEFDNASDNEESADRNEKAQILSKETRRLRDEARRDRIIARAVIGLGTVSLITALIPKRVEKKVFVNLNSRSIQLAYAFSF